MPITRRSVLRSLAGTAAAAAFAPSHAHAEAETSLDGRDPLRPSFHYLPNRNWINDPCGPIFFRGQYHLFHQYNPHASVWGDMHWAHATSPDMMHWKRLPVAMAPSPGGPDADGVFTGSALVQHNGAPAVIYTGVQSVPRDQATLSDGNHDFRETQLLATSADPDLRTWVKHPRPVIPAPPPGMAVTGFRDPAPFTYAGTQYLVLGSGQRGVGGMALLYRARKAPGGSVDLSEWEYLHPLTQDTHWTPLTGPNPPKDPVGTGEMWECPDFFALDDRHVLFFSTRGKTLWQVGDLDPRTLTFHATATGQLDQGRSFYAPKSQLDAHGNRILWGWLNETRPQAEFAAAGWAGMISLPRVLTIENGQLRMRPLPALQQLRRPSTQGGAVQEFTATLRRQPGVTTPPVHFVRDAIGPLLAIRGGPVEGATISGPDDLVVPPGTSLSETPTLHAFFDNSVLELFVDGTLCFTHRFYSRSPQTPIATVTLPRTFTVEQPRTYAIQSIWPV